MDLKVYGIWFVHCIEYMSRDCWKPRNHDHASITNRNL